MDHITSFHGSEISPEQLNALLAEQLAAEHARVFRSLLVKRLSALAFAAAVLIALWRAL